MDHHQNVWLISVPAGRFPRGVQSPLQSTYLHSRRFNKSHPQLLVMNLYYAGAN